MRSVFHETSFLAAASNWTKKSVELRCALNFIGRRLRLVWHGSEPSEMLECLCWKFVDAEKRAAKKKKVVGKRKVGKSKRGGRKKREWERERKKEKKERECTTYENKRGDWVWSSVFQHSSKIAWQSQHKYFISNSSMFAEQPEPIRPMTTRRQVQKFTIKLFANIWIAKEVSARVGLKSLAL